MIHNITIDKSRHTKAALSIINCFLKLSNRELDIVVAILDNNIKEINKQTREIIKESIDIDNYGLNNYLLKLRNKGIIINNKLSDKIIEASKDQEIIIKINVN